MSDNPTLRADNNPKFYSRFKWLGLAALGFMVYCLYDGYVNWPEQQTRGVAFLELAEATLSEERLAEAAEGSHGAGEVYQHLVEDLEDEEALAAAWAAKAEENGWPAAPPEKLRTDGDIVGQYVMAGLAGLGGLWFLSTVLMSSGRWVELDGDTLNTSWGQSFSTNQVTAIDKRQWKDKGIARVKYRDAGGGTRKFVVDDYKFHRKTTDQILRQIELQAGVDKITGGKPEPDPAEVAAAAEAQQDETPA